MADTGKADSDKAKKLAAELQAASTSETFDLAGYGPAALQYLVASGLGTPIKCPAMLRFTFVVGGGKKVRQKYDEKLSQLFADALKTGGFTEDRGAALTLECQGTFKQQHDTDKDLKFVHVFPRVELQEASIATGDANLTPEELIVFADISAFQTMISKKTVSLTQRRRALDVVKAARARLAATEVKLAEMQELTSEDQQFYDSADDEGLQQKQEVLQIILDNMISKGQLTKNEQKEVLVQLQEKLDAIDTQIQAAAAAGQAKKEGKLREVREKLESRRVTVTSAAAIVHKPKYEAEIKAVQKRLAALAVLEKSAKVLPLEDVLKLNAKPKLVADLEAMQAESRGWFAEAQ